MKRLRPFIPELVAFGLLVLAFVISAVREPKFLDIAYLFDRSTLYTETALLAIALTLVIVAGHIDLSCTSILALVGAVVITLHHKGLPFGLCAALAPLLGGLLGAFNGYLIGKRKLPSLVVTLATMALFRGGAQILLGDHGEKVPESFQHFEKLTIIPKTYFQAPLALTLAFAVAAGLLLHKTVFGRQVYAVGTNAEAARYSGVPVPSVLMRLFVLSGVVAGIAALTLLSRLGVARFDHARGQELDAITAVVLGGTSIFGGRGTVVGSLAALLLIGVVQTGMGVAGIKVESQVTVIGILLLVAVLLANLTSRRRR